MSKMVIMQDGYYRMQYVRVTYKIVAIFRRRVIMAASLWHQCACRIPCQVYRCVRSSSTLHLPSCLQSRECSSQSLRKETIVIPKKKPRDDLSVLRALSKTVPKDSTALPYVFHDDPYLLPKSAAERRRYYLSKESGKKAAQHIIQSKPDLFLGLQTDQPKIEAFYPPVEAGDLGAASEEAILALIERSDMQAALKMLQELKESGHPVSMETTNALLELLCFHGGQPTREESVLRTMLTSKAEGEEEEEASSETSATSEEAASPEPGPEAQKQRGRWRTKQEPLWKDGNLADQLFDSIEEPDSQIYNSMIRGLAKHGAHSRAFTLYNEMQERGIQADVHAYNALIEGSINIRDDYRERWSVMSQLMQQMDLEKISPNLQTFNALLNNLRIMGAVGRKRALQAVAEMKACAVEPSLGTYSLLLMIFYKDSLPPSDILYDIMDTIEGQDFTINHPRDVEFFKNAMSVCLSLRDVELAYRVDLLLNTGENYKLAGNYDAQNIYYGKFFHLICLMDNADTMVEYYDKLVPSALIPSIVVYMDMLRSLETACTYDHIPRLWEDICTYGHRYRQNVLELLVQVMATSTDASPEQKARFCSIALDVVAAVRESASRIDPVKFGSVTMDYLISICLQARSLDSSWQILKLFQERKHMPSIGVLEDFIQLCVEEEDAPKALACVKMAVGSGLTGAINLADRIKSDMKLGAEQRRILDDVMLEEDLMSGQGSAL